MEGDIVPGDTRPHFVRRFAGVCLLVSLFVSPNLFAQTDEIQVASAELNSLSIEELMSVEVTSVSKKKERKQDAAAAVYVLTQEDIRRSGATNIPDLLRTVPGVEVARLTANTWSVTARGFGGRFANKLLVLIDGRSIYTPLFSGVYWEGHDVMLEDVDRIEIIRGPGGTLWGANAVNGVVNIVTKAAGDTQGGLVSGGVGTEERGFFSTRWGDKIGEDVDYRVYVKGFARDAGGDPEIGGDAQDDWNNVQGGFRFDWRLSPDDLLTIQGDLNDLGINQVVTDAFLEEPFERSIHSQVDYLGRNLLTRWTHTLSDDSKIEVQGYYDGYTWDEPTFRENRDTFDLHMEHSFSAANRHEIIWGAGLRLSADQIDGSEFASFDPSNELMQLYDIFIQDDITLLDELHLIIGTKLEYNNFSGFEIQPNARLRWSPNDHHTLWAAVSRAVRTPSRAEAGVRLRSSSAPGPTEFVLMNVDGREFQSEDLFAAEFGYRVRANDKLALDFALFYNRYTDMRSLEFEEPFDENGVTVVPLQARNGSRAKTYGFELAADWAPSAAWQVRAGYSLLQLSIDSPPDDPVTETFSQDTPQQQFFIQNHIQFPRNVEFDSTVRYVDALSEIDVDSYVELDARLAWRPREDLELAIVGQNLLHGNHFEFAPTFVGHVPTQVERGVYAKVTWRF